VTDGPLVLEVVKGDGSVHPVSLSVDEANALLAGAHEAAKTAGLAWVREPIKLKPAPKLTALIKRSRADVAAGAADEAV
jgi:hypothetical protein